MISYNNLKEEIESGQLISQALITGAFLPVMTTVLNLLWITEYVKSNRRGLIFSFMRGAVISFV
jgi:hypothetical protein